MRSLPVQASLIHVIVRGAIAFSCDGTITSVQASIKK